METIKSDNELIAEFMGFVDGGNYWASNGQKPYFKEPDGHRFYPYQLRFEESWDWLMPVVEKIEEIKVKDTDEEGREIEWQFSFEIKDKQAMIHRDVLPQYHGTDQDFLKLYDCRNTSKIQSVKKAVVEFIKWYNTQKL